MGKMQYDCHPFHLIAGEHCYSAGVASFISILGGNGFLDADFSRHTFPDFSERSGNAAVYNG